MIEIRRVIFGPNEQLEYRYCILSVGASGNLSPLGDWSDWKIVEIIDADDAYDNFGTALQELHGVLK